jgi:hypothetical protein
MEMPDEERALPGKSQQNIALGSICFLGATRKPVMHMQSTVVVGLLFASVGEEIILRF